LTDVKKLLFEICEDERVFDKDIDLIESGLLDSYATIELLSAPEDEGIEIQITQIDRDLLHTVSGIEKLIDDALKKQQNSC